jgi:hypothetical protein
MRAALKTGAALKCFVDRMGLPKFAFNLGEEK